MTMDSFYFYKHLPWWAQNFVISIYGKKLSSQRFNQEHDRILSFLEQSENWSEEKIRSYKEEQIERLLNQAYYHTHFYRKKYDEAKVVPSDFHSLEDLEKFPILTKEEVRSYSEAMIADNVKKHDLIPGHTSGSTGKALCFQLSKHNNAFYWAIVTRSYSRFGFRRGLDEMINFTGRPIVPIDVSTPPFCPWKPAGQPGPRSEAPGRSRSSPQKG